MWTVNVIFPHGRRLFAITPRGLLITMAGLALALLLGWYVVVLQDSVQRGQRLRAEQHSAATKAGHKTAQAISLARAPTDKP